MKRRRFLYGTGAVLSGSILSATALATTQSNTSDLSISYQGFKSSLKQYQDMIGESFILSSDKEQVKATLTKVLEHTNNSKAQIEQFTLVFDTPNKVLDEKIYFARSAKLKETPIFMNTTREGFAEASFSYLA